PPVPGPKITGFDGHVLKTVKPEDIFSTCNFQSILPAPECPDQVEYLMVLDSEEDSENPGSKACQDKSQQVTDQNTSDQKTWNKLNITDHSNHWKLPALAHNCQDSDPESTALNTSQHLNVPQHKPDIYQNGPCVISHKHMARSSPTFCTCNVEQNVEQKVEQNVEQKAEQNDGVMVYTEQKQRADCKQKLMIEQEEDYSKVSGIYREIVLVIQKDNSPVQRHKKTNNDDDPRKKIKNKNISSAKDSTDTQEYVAAL
ncbi:hypothetical protein AMELA_G00239550, partial [Ameiurus melas]